MGGLGTPRYTRERRCRWAQISSAHRVHFSVANTHADIVVSAQEHIYLGHEQKVLMRSDIVLRRAGRVMTIAVQYASIW